MLRRLILPALAVFVITLTWSIQRGQRRYTAQVAPEESSVSSATGSSLSSDSSSSSETGSSATGSLVNSSSSLSLPASSAAASLGAAIPIEPGSCATVKPDPVTGKKLVYCCLDEIITYQKEATPEELKKFVLRLKELETLPGADAKIAFESTYESPIHRKYNWQTLCGRKVPCEVCSINRICGNGVKEADEQCDSGPMNSDAVSDRCRLDCTRARCGDGVVDINLKEECDDGLGNSDRLPNACRLTCKRPSCGDNVIDTDLGETCDAGPSNSDNVPNSCRTDCHLPFCGDGVMDRSEECDDGNGLDGDGCSARCAKEDRGEVSSLARCGNGFVDEGEQCDAGANNANVPDACRLNCFKPTCGDNIKDSNEECDDGNMASGDGCNAACLRENKLTITLTQQCGDGVPDAGEECDAGLKNENIPDACRFDCTFPRCGDGITDSGEQCDDGNNRNGDGCNDQCLSEFCGDALILMGEQCDDGNLVSGDGCDAQCRREVASPTGAIIVRTSSASGMTYSSFSSSSVEGLHSAGSVPGSEESASAFAAGSSLSMTLQQQSESAAAVSSSALSSVMAGTASSQAASPPSIFSSAGYVTLSPLTPSSLRNEGLMSNTGPAALSLLAMGGAAGWAWMRKKKRK